MCQQHYVKSLTFATPSIREVLFAVHPCAADFITVSVDPVSMCIAFQLGEVAVAKAFKKFLFR